MSTFIPNRPVSLDEPKLVVDSRDLGVGTFHFRLRVTGASGQISPTGTIAVVTILPSRESLAVLRLPPVVREGVAFRLFAGESTDGQGERFKRFQWTLTPPAPGRPVVVTTEQSSVVIGRDPEVPDMPRELAAARLSAGDYEITVQAVTGTAPNGVASGPTDTQRLRVIPANQVSRVAEAQIRILVEDKDAHQARPGSAVALDAKRSTSVAAGARYLWTWWPPATPNTDRSAWVQSVTDEPVLKLDPPPEPGVHRFQLVILNSTKAPSEPVDAVLEVIA